MSIYTRRLGALFSVVAGDTRIFLADSQYAYVIRDIVVDNSSFSTGHIEVFLALPSLYAVRLINLATMAATSSFQWKGRQVVAAGESLWIRSSIAGPGVLVTGYALTP